MGAGLLCDRVDGDLREALTVALLAFVALTSLLLENDDLITADVIVNGGRDGGPSDRWGADGGIAAVRDDKVDLVEGDLATFFGIELVDEELLALGHFELLTSDGDDSKHDGGGFENSRKGKVRNHMPSERTAGD